ncbi:MAG: carbonic anhydrase [Halobacteriales archaeon]|nr:carbonic anhydrase [Halobacteriales archaeon]
MDATFVDLLRNNADHAREFEYSFEEVQDSQHPTVVSVCCSDSRVLQDRMWGNDEPGRMFTCANIGNRVLQRTVAGEVVSGDVLYPLEYLDTKLAVVVGHTGCGAVTATYDHLRNGGTGPPGIEYCIDLLKPRLEPGVEALPEDVDRAETINRLVEYNVDRQVAFLVESDDVPDDVTVVGVVYDFQDVYSDRRGEVHLINVDGETDVETLRNEHPEIDSRIRRLWEY